MYIGSKGTILFKNYENVKAVESNICSAIVDWDKNLTPYGTGVIAVRKDIARYVIYCERDKSAPAKGNSKMCNEIYNIIASYPDGVSTHDLECNYGFNRDSLRGRISEMKSAGRIVCKTKKKYYNRGKPSSVWVLAYKH